MGEISYGKGIDEHIEKTGPVLCANTSPVVLEISKYKEAYYIAYCTHLQEDPYVHKLQELFVAEGIPCECEKQKNFIEALAVF